MLNISEQILSVDEHCAMLAERAMRCARNDGGGNTYGPEFARVLVCKRLATNIIALRTQQAAGMRGAL